MEDGKDEEAPPESVCRDWNGVASFWLEGDELNDDDEEFFDDGDSDNFAKPDCPPIEAIADPEEPKSSFVPIHSYYFPPTVEEAEKMVKNIKNLINLQQGILQPL